MKKKINAVYYFLDIGCISLAAILGFVLGVSKLLGMVMMMLMVFLSVAGTVHLQNKE